MLTPNTGQGKMGRTEWLFVCCLALAVAGNQRLSCYDGDSDCPPCPPGRTESFDSTFYLMLSAGGYPQMYESVKAAQKVIKTYERNHDVIELRPLLLLHTTLNYFCCHTAEEKSTILSILESYPWQAANLTFQNVSCNLDHNNATTYLLALPNSTAQDYLFQWVHGVEREMNASGVPVINPRKQPFHCTLALVDTHQYPVQPALAAVASAVPLFSTVTFDQFFVNGRQIRPPTDTAV